MLDNICKDCYHYFACKQILEYTGTDFNPEDCSEFIEKERVEEKE